MDDAGKRYQRFELERKYRLAIGGLVLLAAILGGWLAGRNALAAYYNTRGERLKSQLRWDEAFPYFDRALSLDPRFPTPYFRIGEIYRTQSFWRVDPTRVAERQQLARQAIDAYEKSLRLNSRQIGVIMAKAKAYELSGDLDGAMRAFNQAAELSPTNAYIFQEIGLFHRRHGEEEKAIAAFKKSKEFYWGEVVHLNLFDYPGQ
jgi:tetratricopeptide (TPR) repeat protein